MAKRRYYSKYPAHTSSTASHQRHQRIGIIVSLLLHCILLSVLISSKAPIPPPLTTIEVTIEPPLTKSNRAPPQIVSPTQQPQSTPLDNTNRLSDTDSRAEVEKIKRGDGGGIPGESKSVNSPQNITQTKEDPRQKASTPAKVTPRTSETKITKPESTKSKQAPTPKDLNLKDLTLDQDTLALKFGGERKPQNQNREANPAEQTLSDYQAFSRPPGSGAAFVGTAGINDHLPNLPDGDITLLNAKANIYASFVRRVAVQVFTQLRSQGWERLSAYEIRQLEGFATIEAVLSPDGKFIRARLIESSGSIPFDGVLNQSVNNGARDPNPPPGALAKDGLIHFIFKARSWSQMGVSRRSGAPLEQRWLLLATGLE